MLLEGRSLTGNRPHLCHDALIIYQGDITSQVHGLIDWLHFCALSYDDDSSYFTWKVGAGIILTMNAPKAY